MKLLFSLIIACCSVNINLNAPPEILSYYRAQYHLILIFSGNNRDLNYEKSLNLLALDPLGLDRRDILIFEIFTEGGIRPDGTPVTSEEVDQLRRFFSVHPPVFKEILLDKDGSVIIESNEPLPVSRIFDAIDKGSEK